MAVLVCGRARAPRAGATFTGVSKDVVNDGGQPKVQGRHSYVMVSARAGEVIQRTSRRLR